ncbi:MAG: TauD/TfdA dioxygenase family protein [Pseudomonadales bacterium]
MRMTRFAAPLGALVEDVDVRKINDTQWSALNQWFCEHHVLAIRDQCLAPEDQMTFARRWGDLVRHPYAGLEQYPDIIELRNVGKARDINQHWHSDMTYNRAPPKLTMLYALAVPELGGDTAFANQQLAYAALSTGMRATLAGLHAEHSAAGLAKKYQQDSEQAPCAVHPVVRTHDETRRPGLYVCRAFTQRFVGWSRAESLPLLNYLFEHSVKPEFQARHQWRKGDLVLWDNRSLLHFAVHDHADEQPRQIHRLQVRGPVPE